MYLFGSLWTRWTIAFKVTTPMLHVLFASAQLWGSYNFYRMYKRQERLLAELEGGVDDTEAGSKAENTKRDREAVKSIEEAHQSSDAMSHYGSDIEQPDQGRLRGSNKL
jgi:hypothetical protein